MLKCPACASESISLLGAWRSSLALPAACGSCGASCYVPRAASGVPLLASVLVALLAFALASALESWAVAAGGFALAVLGYGLMWRRLQPVAVVALATSSRLKPSAVLGLVDVLTFFSLWK
ncbi:hypothetical protein [Paucibacter sp. Y2R2-4]|uniref:hypothetical protein n=1 Tax=Paucibacter sp. Y2R2-4 TaxID=2893553 RepID=UPI0021E3EF72|nr:hypothetical protein [Paucibacter sp. Y2R2-4]MCV2351552.1 hypothetical protein [Paucibacter sp. Y2R2-4]